MFHVVINPSRAPHSILVKGKDGGYSSHPQFTVAAGDQLEGLEYRLYDENGNPVMVTAEIAEKLTCGWQRDVDLKMLQDGVLPAITAPLQAGTAKKYTVRYELLRCSITVTVLPSLPDHLEVH